MSIPPLFYIVLSSYLLWRVLEKIGISYVLYCCGSWYYLLCHWEKTYTTIFTFLMANKVWGILILQICIDFHNWENHTCTRKLLLIPFRQVISAKLLLKNLQICLEIKTCPVKVMSRSEFKFLSISSLGHPGCLIHLVLYWLWKALQGFQKKVFMKKVSSQFSISNFFTCFEECRVQFAGYRAWFVGLGCGMQVTQCSFT